jgi:hypothetical protein
MNTRYARSCDLTTIGAHCQYVGHTSPAFSHLADNSYYHVAPMQFNVGDKVTLWVNKVGPCKYILLLYVVD